MKLELTFDASKLLPDVWDNVKVSAQAAMANRFATIVHNNFGASGEDRPALWRDLNPVYATIAHDGDRTPTLVLSGELQRSIQIDDTSYDAASVFTNDRTALKHQEGDPETNLPARPFFPMIGDSLTPYTESECIEAGQNAINRILG